MNTNGKSLNDVFNECYTKTFNAVINGTYQPYDFNLVNELGKDYGWTELCDIIGYLRLMQLDLADLDKADKSVIDRFYHTIKSYTDNKLIGYNKVQDTIYPRCFFRRLALGGNEFNEYGNEDMIKLWEFLRDSNSLTLNKLVRHIEDEELDTTKPCTIKLIS